MAGLARQSVESGGCASQTAARSLQTASLQTSGNLRRRGLARTLKSGVPELHVAIAAHEPDPLRLTLLGIAKQTLRPATVIVSADNDDPAVLQEVCEASAAYKRDIVLVQRKHQGGARVAQVRNNAVRALLMLGATGNDRVIGLDGDCVPVPLLCEMHERTGRRGEVVLGSRIDLSDEQTAAFSPSRLRAGVEPVELMPDQIAMLRRRQRRYSWYARLRPLGFVKPHKPKLSDSNYSLRLDDFLRVNGFDEETSAGSRDGDDFGRRVYAAGIPPGIAVMSARAYHLYHPSRDPLPRSGTNSGVFSAVSLRLPWRCVRGLDQPVEQPTPLLRVCRGGGVVDERAVLNPETQPPTASVTR